MALMILELESRYLDAEWMRQQIEKDDESKFEQRLARLQRVKVHRIIPHVWFDAASTECRDMFRDGHFYGCICLSQSVAEGIAKFILQVHHAGVGKQNRPIESCKRPAKGRSLLKKLKGLKSGTRNGKPMSVVSEKCLNAFDCIEGGDRDDFHHLNREVVTDRGELEKRAEACVMALYDIESELFGFDITSGSLTPHQRQYWPSAGKYSKVHLRNY
jgi:hypothetical protein